MQLGWHKVAVVQYTFTHKKYTEQHNETQYPEQNIRNDKNKETNKRIHNITIGIHNITLRIYNLQN